MAKTFRELETGDRILVKNIFNYKPCDVVINGHHYVTELMKSDEIMTISAFSHYENGLGGKFVEFYAFPEMGETHRFEMLKEDLDKTETERFKILE